MVLVAGALGIAWGATTAQIAETWAFDHAVHQDAPWWSPLFILLGAPAIAGCVIVPLAVLVVLSRLLRAMVDLGVRTAGSFLRAVASLLGFEGNDD
jgi:hypothetical protein